MRWPNCRYQFHIEVLLRYLMLQLYWEHGAIMSEILEAPTIPENWCKCGGGAPAGSAVPVPA